MPIGAGGGIMQFLMWLLVVGNIAAVVFGLAMIFAPGRLSAMFSDGEGAFSMRRLTKPLEIQRDADTAMLRYPRLLGAVMLVGAVFIIVQGYFFLARVDTVAGGKLLAGFFAGAKVPPEVWETLWSTMIIFIFIGAVLAAVIGGLSLIKSELLARYAALGNRWLSTRQATKPVSKPYYALDRIVQANPRVFGVIVTLLGLYAAAVLLVLSRGG